MLTPEPPPRRFGIEAIVLIVIGLLILIPSGLCTSVGVIGSIVSAFADSGNGGSALATVLVVLIVGGPFVVVGALLVYRGWRESGR